MIEKDGKLNQNEGIICQFPPNISFEEKPKNSKKLMALFFKEKVSLKTNYDFD